jgi:hypothetical protein
MTWKAFIHYQVLHPPVLNLHLLFASRLIFALTLTLAFVFTLALAFTVSLTFDLSCRCLYVLYLVIRYHLNVLLHY